MAEMAQGGIIGLVLFGVMASSLSAQKADPCKDPRAEEVRLDQRSAVYKDAWALAQALSKHGFPVNCIQNSKEDGLFPTQKGAALYRTNQGDFVVWFLPKTATFDRLEVVRQSEGERRYLYTFRGEPKIAAKFDGSRQTWFIRHQNLMFEVSGDQKLADQLSDVVPHL